MLVACRTARMSRRRERNCKVESRRKRLDRTRSTPETIVPKAGVAPPKRRLAGRWFRNSWRGQIVSPEPRTATTHEPCVEISCASAQHEQAHTMRVFCPCGWRMLVCCCRNVTSGNPSQHRLHQRSALHDHTASCAGSMIHMDYVKLL